jgi:NADH-quinone oxidoreductase subunit G
LLTTWGHLRRKELPDLAFGNLFIVTNVPNPRRLLQSVRRDGDRAVAVDGRSLKEQLLRRMREVGRLAAVVSPLVTVEEAYMLWKLVRGLDPQAVLAMGPVPHVGRDEACPGGSAISEQKCPNRRGVEEILVRAAQRVVLFEDFLTELDRRQIKGAWVSGGYLDPWIDDATAARFQHLALLVVQDLFPSPLSDRASYALPGAAFGEREGSYVNRRQRLQFVHAATDPPAGVRPEGSLLWELLGMPGLYPARQMLDQIAREIPYFHLAGGPIPETGIDLTLNRLAGGG